MFEWLRWGAGQGILATQVFAAWPRGLPLYLSVHVIAEGVAPLSKITHMGWRNRARCFAFDIALTCCQKSAQRLPIGSV